MNKIRLQIAFVLLFCFCVSPQLLFAANPYLPLWEYIPDGEPYVFEDPDRPGEYRVYIYGSHDSMVSGYCGREQVVWSAPVDDLNNWRYDGVIFISRTDAKGNLLHKNGQGDVLYAPDVAEVVDKNGKKTYYLYPNNQEGGRQNMVAKSDRPDGPFVACNWNPANPRRTVGMFGFDPGVLVDDDGRIYGYWGFGTAFAVELDPATMATPKKGAVPVKGLVSGFEEEGVFGFYEASSMRKIKDKYVLVYSRNTLEGEFGMEASNYTLAYAYSDNPLGPFTYGGTLIDGRARDTDLDGNPIATATPGGNTHGSIVEIKGKWYVFYHRQCGTDEFSRQAMVAPLNVSVEEGSGGKVQIDEAEYTSEGFELDGLNPLKRYSAGIACYYTGPTPATHEWPKKTFSGSYIIPNRIGLDLLAPKEKIAGELRKAQEDIAINTNPVINNTDGSVVGYKYFNFDGVRDADALTLLLNLTPEGLSGIIEVYVDSPWEAKGGKKIGSVTLHKLAAKTRTEMRITLEGYSKLEGKHALFFRFSSPEKEKSICTLHDFVFEKK